VGSFPHIWGKRMGKATPMGRTVSSDLVELEKGELLRVEHDRATKMVQLHQQQLTTAVITKKDRGSARFQLSTTILQDAEVGDMQKIYEAQQRVRELWKAQDLATPEIECEPVAFQGQLRAIELQVNIHLLTLPTCTLINFILTYLPTNLPTLACSEPQS
jgi:hypothetical protein